MDFDKTCLDFEKRYGKKCDFVYFIGMPVIFFSSPAMTVGCAVSVGGYAAARHRDDDRIIIQFSDSDRFLNCSYAEMKHNKDEKIYDLFLKAERLGAKNCGAEILLRYNTKLSHPYREMLLCLMNGLCSKCPDTFELIKHFDNYESNTICMYSRKNHAEVFDGQQISYCPLSDSEVKIVIADCGYEIMSVPESPQEDTRKAAEALNCGDLAEFGRLLNRHYASYFSEHHKKSAAAKLFNTAVNLGDAYGSGITRDGRLYSIVKNSMADSYMQNLNREYKQYFGGSLDFYVTRAEDSGIRYVPEN